MNQENRKAGKEYSILHSFLLFLDFLFLVSCPSAIWAPDFFQADRFILI